MFLGTHKQVNPPPPAKEAHYLNFGWTNCQALREGGPQAWALVSKPGSRPHWGAAIRPERLQRGLGQRASARRRSLLPSRGRSPRADPPGSEAPSAARVPVPLPSAGPRLREPRPPDPELLRPRGRGLSRSAPSGVAPPNAPCGVRARAGGHCRGRCRGGGPAAPEKRQRWLRRGARRPRRPQSRGDRALDSGWHARGAPVSLGPRAGRRRAVPPKVPGEEEDGEAAAGRGRRADGRTGARRRARDGARDPAVT